MTSQLGPILIAAATLAFIAVRLRRRRRAGVRAGWGGTARWPLPSARDRESAVFGVVGLVAVREIRQRLRGRAFKVATVIILLGVAAAVIIPAVTKGKAHAEQVGVRLA